MQCINSQLNFNGEMHFAQQANENNTYELTDNKLKDIDFAAPYLSSSMSY